jgi:hypothetical protein
MNTRRSVAFVLSAVLILVAVRDSRGRQRIGLATIPIPMPATTRAFSLKFRTTARRWRTSNIFPIASGRG